MEVTVEGFPTVDGASNEAPFLPWLNGIVKKKSSSSPKLSLNFVSFFCYKEK